MVLKYFLTKLIKKNIPNINNKNCINFKGKINRCDKCRSYCPQNAISFNNKNVIVDEVMCNGCGICRAVCPSQVIGFAHSDEINALKKIKESETILIGCKQNENHGDINFICLNGLHKEYLISLLLTLKGKKVNFILAQCKGCNMSKDSKIFEEALVSAITFIKHLGVTPNVSLIYSKDDIPECNPQVISRRELFSHLKGQSTNIVNEVANDVISNKDIFTPREFLLQSIKPWVKDQSIEIPEKEAVFTNWKITSKCNGCGICETMCPQKAWKIEKEEEYIKISHNAKKCMSCGVCNSICPQEALVKRGFSTNLLKGFDIKLDIYLNICKECNKSYIPQDSGNEEYCSACVKRMKIRESVLKGKMSI